MHETSTARRWFFGFLLFYSLYLSLCIERALNLWLIPNKCLLVTVYVHDCIYVNVKESIEQIKYELNYHVSPVKKKIIHNFILLSLKIRRKKQTNNENKLYWCDKSSRWNYRKTIIKCALLQIIKYFIVQGSNQLTFYLLHWNLFFNGIQRMTWRPFG